MARRPTDRGYDNSFLDYERRKYGLTMPELYHAMGWSRVRYYNHCRRCTELARADLPVLARALGVGTERVCVDEHEFYFNKTRKPYAAKNRRDGA